MSGRLPILGVDFGRVINDGSSYPTGDDTSFLSGGLAAAMATPAMAGALPALTGLTALFDGRVWIVSKCGPRIQSRTEQWLAHHRFFEITGIDPSHARFCRQRREKADHCAELNITHFVDDRADVLSYLVGLVDHLYLFGSRVAHPTAEVEGVRDWPEAESRIRTTLEAQ